MTGDSSKGPVPFECRGLIFGAFEPDATRPVFVVEADSVVQARICVDSVAPLLVGVQRSRELAVIELDEIPVNMPTFLRAFFEAGKVGSNKAHLAAGTNTNTVH